MCAKFQEDLYSGPCFNYLRTIKPNHSSERVIFIPHNAKKKEHKTKKHKNVAKIKPDLNKMEMCLVFY